MANNCSLQMLVLSIIVLVPPLSGKLIVAGIDGCILWLCKISLQPRCCTCSNVIAIHHYNFIEYCGLVQIVWEGTDVAGSFETNRYTPLTWNIEFQDSK